MEVSSNKVRFSEAAKTNFKIVQLNMVSLNLFE